MTTLMERMNKRPIVPYIRSSDFAVRKPWHYAERRLLDYLLIYIKEGVLKVMADGVAYRFDAGQFCLVQPGSIVVLEGETDTITPYAHLDLFYNPERESSFPTRPGQIDLSPYADLMQPTIKEAYGIDVPVRVTPANPKKLAETMVIMVELWQQNDPLMQLKAHHALQEIIIAALDAYTPNKGSYRAGADPLKWIVAHFSAHLNEPLSVPQMAARANLSPSRFSALFKQRYAMPPHRYLLDMRISHAKDLLDNPELSQEHIAQYCGFADVHHFSKIFRKACGMTPGEWRSSRRNSAANPK